MSVKESGSKTWKIVKSKNGANHIEQQFHLEPVPLGEDEDGNPISSAVVSPVISIQKMKSDHNNDKENEDRRILQVIHDNPNSLQKDWATNLGYTTDKMSKQKSRLIAQRYLTEKGNKISLTQEGIDLIKAI